jgi:hypothetical protein
MLLNEEAVLVATAPSFSAQDSMIVSAVEQLGTVRRLYGLYVVPCVFENLRSEIRGRR